MSTRTHADYQSMGIMNGMLEHVGKYVSRDYPDEVYQLLHSPYDEFYENSSAETRSSASNYGRSTCSCKYIEQFSNSI